MESNVLALCAKHWRQDCSPKFLFGTEYWLILQGSPETDSLEGLGRSYPQSSIPFPPCCLLRAVTFPVLAISSSSRVSLSLVFRSSSSFVLRSIACSNKIKRRRKHQDLINHAWFYYPSYSQVWKARVQSALSFLSFLHWLFIYLFVLVPTL